MENLKALRKAANLTCIQLGEKVGCTAMTISRYETGKREPNLETLRRLAAALGVTVDELIRKDEG